MTREKNPKYESMSLEELKANMEKSKKELEQAMRNKNILEQRKNLRLIRLYGKCVKKDTLPMRMQRFLF